MTTNRGRSIIFYPRSYNTRGEQKKHSVLGLTDGGKIINVKLRLDEKHEDKQNAPSIKEFAKTDYLAKNPCIPSEDNSPENPEGVLLLSRCFKEGYDSEKGVDVYIARWAVVLSPSSQTPPLHKGLGRMEIKKDSSTVKKLRGLMRKAESDNKLDDADALKKQIEDPTAWSYPAIFYFPEKMVTFSLDNTKGLEEKVSVELDNLSKSGIVSGLALRARNKSNEVIKETYKEVFSKFIISATRYQNGLETFKSIIEDLSGKYSNKDYKWDAIPIKKINTGPSSSRYYGLKEKLSFTRSMFTFDSNDSEPRLSKICARVSYFGDTDNTLLSRLYTTSEPLDHPARLDKAGHFSLTYTGEGTKLAHLPNDDESISQIRDGFTEDERLINRAFWLIEGNVPIIRSLETTSDLNNDSEIQDNTSEEVNDHISSPEIEDLSKNSDEEDCLVVQTEPVSSLPSARPETADTEDADDLEEISDDSLGDDDKTEAYEQSDGLDNDDQFEFNDIEGDSEEIESKTYEEHKIAQSGKSDSDETDMLSDEHTDKNHVSDHEPSELEEDTSNNGSVDSHKPTITDESDDSRIKEVDNNEKPSKMNDSSSKEKPPVEGKKLTGMAASLFKK